MSELERIGERILAYLEDKNAARDRALQQSRSLIRNAALAIRAAHRSDGALAKQHLAEAAQLAGQLRADLAPYPDLFHAGYTQDAFKELVEASIVCALLAGESLPEPEQMQIEYAAYLGGLAEAVGELRRRALDQLRHDQSEEPEALLDWMDDIYALLITIDFPDAITGGLRRLTDIVRSLVERTRGDLTTSAQQRKLKAALERLEAKLEQR